jgi:hypothetical protein
VASETSAVRVTTADEFVTSITEGEKVIDTTGATKSKPEAVFSTTSRVDA